MISMPLKIMKLRTGGLASVLGATFGKNVRMRNGVPKNHQGWDLYAPVGTVAFAIAPGRIVWTREQGDYGKQLLLEFNKDGSLFCRSDPPIYAFYAHLSEFFVKKGVWVDRGDRVALTGVSGNADPQFPHLHFEIRTTSSQSVTGLKGRLGLLHK